ncbi:hypothetical protein [Devosia sp. RR2S18]|uniref:hypothetical protein n=1 Tax=Devosia rhizosphaerae TaxID=3049774 RepID=UPI0025402491|nr:hypothetical protein [Devosia sp. RR2S18]WIJ23517.1 hypothetical protein QOV41_10545 [Devosia sp. RR2S18]
MKIASPFLLALLPVLAVGSTLPAQAQEAVYACSSQQELEQTIASDGSILPENCSTLTVTSLESQGESLCLLQLEASEEDLLGSLRDAALSSEWWVRCDALGAALVR